MWGKWTFIVSVFAALTMPNMTLANTVPLGELRIHEPWARATIGVSKTAAAYLTVMNQGSDADHLIGIATPVAENAMLHTTAIGDDGVMKMRPVEAIEVPAGGEVRLEPGGPHIMLMGVHEPLMAGEHFPLTLSFERAGDVTVTVPVADIAAGFAEQEPENHESH